MAEFTVICLAESWSNVRGHLITDEKDINKVIICGQ